MYSAKSIAIIGGETLLGRILLTKFVGVINSQCRIILLQAKPASDKKVTEAKPISRDPYFKLSIEKSQAQNRNRVELVYLEYTVGEAGLEVKGNIGNVDYLFNCYVPYEPFSLVKSMDKHVIWTSKLLSYLEKHQPQCTVVALSSIYSQ